ncbi:unnamed protein product [Urochloa decumbens]|uniref:F-box domain-containing protein n=1 Tax=Urochloa decumbens TaxID=240449 RepID=A0ABC8WI50_9POAL
MRSAGQMLDETPAKKPKVCSAGDTSGGDAASADRLSALPDEVLHHVMSFLRAWEVARTCVLSRRWRHVWASAPCVDLRVWRLGRHCAPPDRFAKFAYRFLLQREASAPVDTLRLLSSPGYGGHRYRQSPPSDEPEYYSSDDVDAWIRAAIKRRARVIQLTAHPKDETYSGFWHANIVSCHLKVLVLSESLLSDRTLRQLSSRCPSLEVLDLKKCSLKGSEISSASLRSLTIVECSVMQDLTIASPNLLSLRCFKPYHRAPLFQNMGSITTATIMLDDSFLHVGYENDNEFIHKTAHDEGSDSDCSVENDPPYSSDSCSDASTCEFVEILTDSEDEQCDDHGQGPDHCKHCKCNHGPYCYGRRNRFDVDKILGGHNVLHSLSNATNLELLAGAGEVILNRELKTCPVFGNLKTLSLGEWCITADFYPLISLLQHSPNLERLFIELKLYDDDDTEEEMEDSTKLVGRSFACTHLKIVKIKCLEYEYKVHLLADLFTDNGVPVEKIFVRRQSICHYIKPVA